jgi:hypothetical protein
MKGKNMSQVQNQKITDTQQPATVVASNQSKTDLKPSTEAVAKKAYFSYLNEGAVPGQDVRHWLEAEAHLLGNCA